MYGTDSGQRLTGGRRRRASLALALVGVLLAAACGSTPPSHKKHTPRPVAAVTPTPAPTATAAPTPAPLSAPIIVQVENAPEARPQSGLAAASIIYEYATEGGITRFSAIYFNPQPVGDVGPVRSARLVTILLTQIYRGTLLFSGCSSVVCAVMAAQKIASYSEGAFGDTFRISTRVAPHNLYTNGGHLGDLLGHSAQPPTGYQLWGRQSTFTGGAGAGNVTVPLSGFETPTFSWNTGANAYFRTEPTGLFTDADTGQAVPFPNLVILQVPQMPAGYSEDVNGAPGLEYSLTGSGPGQVFVGGQEFNITWSEPASGAPPTLTLQSGGPAPLAPGLVYFALDPTGSPATFTP